MTFSMSRLSVFSLFIVLLIAGCTSMPKPEGKPLPGITFAHLKPIELSVARLEAGGQGGAVDDGFIMSPYNFALGYFRHRFKAAGDQDILKMTIRQADVRHVTEPSKQKIASFLDVAGFDVYQISLELNFEHMDDSGQLLYGKTLTAQRQLRISEHASIAQRERAQLETMDKMFAELDPHVRLMVKEMGLTY